MYTLTEDGTVSRPRILVVGSCNMDYTFAGDRFPREGETVMGDSFSTAAGGKGANQACQAARAGAEVSFVGRTGCDSNGEILMKGLEDMGIDTSMVIRDPDSTTGCALIELERYPGGTRNRIMVVPGAQMRFMQGELDMLRDRIADYDIVLLQLEINQEADLAVAEMAAEAGVPVMMNPAPYAPMSSELLHRITFISPNEHEATEMTGIEITDADSARRAAEAIVRTGPENVIITLGENGAVFFDGRDLIHCPCVKADAVDPTAAGDSFVGAFCAAHAAGMDAGDAMVFASHAASITVSGFGAQPSIPGIDRIAQSLRKSGYPADGPALAKLMGGK